MKVLAAITQTHFGGAQRFMLEYAKHLNEKVDLKVVVGSDGDGELTRRLESIGVRCVELAPLRRPLAPLSDLRAVCNFRRLVREERPDLVFLTSSKAGFVGSLATRLAGRGDRCPPVIYRIGGWAFKDPGSRWRQTAWRLIERLVSRLRRTVIVNSPEDFELAERYRLAGRNGVELIANGVSPEEGEGLAASEARLALSRVMKVSFDPEEKWIGCVAGFYPAKGLVTLVEAAYILVKRESPDVPPWRIVLIGDGPERPLVEKAVALRNLDTRVLLAGHVVEARDYLRAFDTIVLPSSKEGLPWILLEAMAQGLPVVATAVGGVPELLAYGESGLLVPPGAPSLLADALLQILADHELRRRLATAGMKTVQARYSLVEMLTRYDQVLGLNPVDHDSAHSIRKPHGNCP